MKRCSIDVILGFLLVLARANAAEELALGPLVVSVSDAWTAQLFHIVDQLSEWDDATHKQYGRWAAKALSFDQRDRKLLEEHAALRRARGWEQERGFEPAFYVEDPIEVAAQKAIDRQLLTPQEAMAKKAILIHFSPKLSVLRDQGTPTINSFRERLRRETAKIAPVLDQLAQFLESQGRLALPLFLIPNPEEGNAGGGYNGGRLVLEVQGRPDPLPTFFHECIHAFFRLPKHWCEAWREARLHLIATSRHIPWPW